MEEKLAPVEVEWVDAQSSLGMDSIKELRELGKEDLVTTKSCGYLIKADSHMVILGFMNFGEGNIKHSQIIPRGMVRKIKLLKEQE